MKPLDAARSFVGRTVRRTRDRMLHPFRARQARESLTGRRYGTILVLCHGNICRSPLLQASLRKHLADRGRHDIEVRSAGFVGPDRPAPANAVAVGRQMGFDLADHRSAIVTSMDLQGADLIVVMSGHQSIDVRWRGAPSHVPVIVLGDLDTEQIDERTIFDPWNHDESVFRTSYSRIDRCAEELATIVAATPPNRG